MAQPNFATGENLNQIIAPSGQPDTIWSAVTPPDEYTTELQALHDDVAYAMYKDYVNAKDYYENVKNTLGTPLYNSYTDLQTTTAEKSKLEDVREKVIYVNLQTRRETLDLLKEKAAAASRGHDRNSVTFKYIEDVVRNLVRYHGFTKDDYYGTLINALNDRINQIRATPQSAPTTPTTTPTTTPAPTTTTTPTPGSTTTGTQVATTPSPTPVPGGTTPTAPVATSTEVRQEDLSARNDSDQCKISRLYEPLEMLYFSSKFRAMRSEAFTAAIPNAEVNPLADQITQGKYFITSLYEQPGILKFDLRWNGMLLNVGGLRPESRKFIGIDYNDTVNDKPIEFIHKDPKLTSVHSCNTLDQMHCFYLKNEVNNFFVPELIFMKAYRERISDNPRKFGGVTKAIHIQFPLAFEDFSMQTEAQTNDVDNKVRKRINQVGVSSFKWSYQGTDTFTADRDISATLVIEAESLDAIFKERINSVGEKYRISDLILQSDCFEKKVKTSNPSPETAQTTNVDTDNFYLFGPEGRTIYDPECYEIIVNCGNHIEENILNSLIKTDGYEDQGGNGLSGFHLGSSYTERAQYAGIHSGESYVFSEIKPDSFKQTLALTVVDHTFNFNDTGGVSLTIEYRARIEGALRKSDADITLKSNASFASTEQTKELNKKVLEALGGGDETAGQTLFNEIDSFAKNQRVSSGAQFEDQGLISRYYYRDSSLDIQNVGDFARVTDAYAHELSSRDDYNTDKRNQETVSKLNSALAIIRKDSVYSFFQQVYTSLFVNNCITTLKVGSKELSEYLIRPTIKNLKKIIDILNAEFSSDAPSLDQWIDLSLKDVPANLPAASQTPGTAPPAATQGAAQAKRINFVFFGDLLDHIFLVSGYQKTNRNLRVVLGNIHLPYTNANLSTSPEHLFPFSLASIPISLTTLNSFFTTIADGSKEKYPISALLRDLVNIVLSSATDSNCMNQLKFPSYRTKMLNFSDVNPDNWEGYAYAERLRTDLLPVQSQRYIHVDDLAQGEEAQVNLDHTDFILITCEAPSYREISDGDIVKDFYNKVPHCRLGHLDGIFTKLKLSKTDQPFLKEARFRDSKGNSLMQLSNVYDGYFEMIGNNLLMLGSLIYYDPTTYGPSYMGNPQTPGSLAYFMGLGGLHLVTELTHDISDNKYTTTAKARFVSRGTLKKPQ